MSDAPKSQAVGITDHPLWPTILQWCSVGMENPHMPPFLSETEFHALINGLSIHDESKKNFKKPYNDSALLGGVLCGMDYDADIHRVLYQATGHPLGYALAFAATIAEQSGFLAPFRDSLRREGLIKALEAWSHLCELDGDFRWDKELKWVNRTLVGVNEVAADFWLAKCQEMSGSKPDYLEKLGKELANAASAKRGEKKTRARGVPPKASQFKAKIQLLWVPAALWLLPDASIAATVCPDLKAVLLKHMEHVRADISTLKLSGSRWRSGTLR
jgi:hypothetical protein